MSGPLALFQFEGVSLPIREDLRSAFRREWARLALPGTWWSGEERVGIAAEVRRAACGQPRGGDDLLGGPAVEAARILGVESALATGRWVEGLVEAGLTYPRYVELIGVVARITAVDGFHRALGLALEPLPSPVDGPPARTDPPRRARRGRGFVPMVGGTSIVQALSLVPAELEAQEDLHGPMYLSYEQMGLFDIQLGLHRTQMELVAARLSVRNRCFY